MNGNSLVDERSPGEARRAEPMVLTEADGRSDVRFGAATTARN